MRKETGMGTLILIVLLLFSQGISGFWAMLKSFASGLWEMLLAFALWAVRFPSEIGLNDYISTRLLYRLVCIVTIGIGITLSYKTKKKVFAVCGSIVGIVSILLTLYAAQKQ